MSRLSGGQRRTIDFAAASWPRLSSSSWTSRDRTGPGLQGATARSHSGQVDDDATIVMTTHDLAEAEHLASRVLIMNEGRILADGTVTALRERLDRGAEITWVQDGTHHVHSTHRPGALRQGARPRRHLWAHHHPVPPWRSLPSPLVSSKEAHS